jgi:hypothetical protein
VSPARSPPGRGSWSSVAPNEQEVQVRQLRDGEAVACSGLADRTSELLDGHCDGRWRRATIVGMSEPGEASAARPARKPFPSSRGKEFGTLQQVFDDVWWAWGTTRFLPGATFPRNMTIVREGADLVIIHPVMMPPAEQAKLEALGTIRHIVRLGDFHGMDDAAYVEKYRATSWAPRGVTGRQPDVAMEAGGMTPFADGTLHAFEVARVPETVLHLPRHGGILLTCDSVQNWERRPAGTSFLGAVMAKVMGFKGRACIGPGWRKQCEPKTGTSFGPRFRALLDLELRHLISAHGPPILDTARDDLRAAVDRLYPPG